MPDQKSVEVLILFTPFTFQYPVLHRLFCEAKQRTFGSLPLNPKPQEKNQPLTTDRFNIKILIYENVTCRHG